MPEPKRLIVDVACGTLPWPLFHRVQPNARRLSPSEHYLGLDDDPASLASARQKASNFLKRSPATLARFAFGRVRPGQPLPVEDGAAHEVHHHQAFRPEADPEWLFSEMARVLRPGGRAYLTVNAELAPKLIDYLSRSVSGVKTIQALRRHGFRVVRMTQHKHELKRYTQWPLTGKSFHVVMVKRRPGGPRGR
jgi:SAM-dependent methyltransferase